MGLNTFWVKNHGYLQAQKGQVIRHTDAQVGRGGLPGTFQNST